MSRSQKALKLKKAMEEIESRHKDAQAMVVNKQCIEMMREKGDSSKSSDVKENNTAQIGKIWIVASLAIGVQLGWVLQAVILRRLVYNLKINNGWKLIFWACGPISGMVVPLIIEYTSKSGSLWRRKRYIAIGSVLACLGSLLVGFAPNSVPLRKVRHNNLLVNGLYAIGFLILSVSYNMIGSPTQSWLSDLAKGDPRIIRTGNMAFTVFLAFGSILGYIAGSDWELWLSHHSYVIDRGGIELFANVKMLYGIHAILIVISVVVVLATMSEPPRNPSSNQEDDFIKQVKVALNKPMLLLYVVNALNWFAFYSFVTYSVAWVADLFHGYDGHHGISNIKMAESQTYYALMLSVLILGLSSLLVGPVSRALGGLNRLWAGTNFLLAALLASTVLISHKAEHNRSDPTLKAHTIKIIRTYLYLLFAVLGFVQAGMYSVPKTLSSIYSEKYTREGRVMSTEVSNMSIVIPQLLALVLFNGGPIVGHGYVPVFLCSAVCAVLSGILTLKLPDPSYATSSDNLEA